MNADLEEAEALLAAYTRPNKSHMNLSVVLGMQARVALTMQDYAAAASLCGSGTHRVFAYDQC